jgi:steroid delta-isomerase-like uncharacterized protein
MTAEANKAIFRRFAEGINQGNMQGLNELFSTNVVLHDPTNPRVRNLEDYKELHTGLRAAFPDAHFSIEDVIAEGDKVACRFTFHGTHTGSWRGAPPTGKPVIFTGIEILRIAGGKIVERWVNTDALGLRQQLGLIPAMG